MARRLPVKALLAAALFVALAASPAIATQCCLSCPPSLLPARSGRGAWLSRARRRMVRRWRKQNTGE